MEAQNHIFDEMDIAIDDFVGDLLSPPYVDTDPTTPINERVTVPFSDLEVAVDDIASVSHNTRNRKYPSSRWWICTYFVNSDHNPITDTEAGLKKIFDNLKATALEGQCEVTSQGLMHYQFTVYFKNTVRMSHLTKKVFGIHVEQMRSKSAISYCRKELSRVSLKYYTFGVFPIKDQKISKKGSLDWDVIKKDSINGAFDNIPSRIFIQYNSAIMRIHALYANIAPPLDLMKGVWIYGPPGTGKTSFVHYMFNPRVQRGGVEQSTLYTKSLDKWWDGFTLRLHRNVLLDEMNPDHMKYLHCHMKFWTDRYSRRECIKGSSIIPDHSLFITTSNYSIADCTLSSNPTFLNDEALFLAIERRNIQVYIPSSGDCCIDFTVQEDLSKLLIGLDDSSKQNNLLFNRLRMLICKFFVYTLNYGKVVNRYYYKVSIKVRSQFESTVFYRYFVTQMSDYPFFFERTSSNMLSYFEENKTDYASWLSVSDNVALILSDYELLQNN